MSGVALVSPGRPGERRFGRLPAALPRSHARLPPPHPFVRRRPPTRAAGVPLPSAHPRCRPRASRFNFSPDLMTEARYSVPAAAAFPPTRRHQLDSALRFAQRDRLRERRDRYRAGPGPAQRAAAALGGSIPAPPAPSAPLRSARPRGTCHRARQRPPAAGGCRPARRAPWPAGGGGGAARWGCGGGSGAARLPAPSLPPSDGRGAAAGGRGGAQPLGPQRGCAADPGEEVGAQRRRARARRPGPGTGAGAAGRAVLGSRGSGRVAPRSAAEPGLGGAGARPGGRAARRGAGGWRGPAVPPWEAGAGRGAVAADPGRGLWPGPAAAAGRPRGEAGAPGPGMGGDGDGDGDGIT